MKGEVGIGTLGDKDLRISRVGVNNDKSVEFAKYWTTVIHMNTMKRLKSR